MHSQCPTCHTVFAVTEEQLDAHHGLVRCGKCRDIFNASWNLVDSDASSAPVTDSGSSPVPESDPNVPRPSRETDARKAMLELLGDVDPETEAELLEQARQASDTENDPLPPVTDYDDDIELRLEIDPAVPRQAVSEEVADTGQLNQNRDSLQLELPAGFSDFSAADTGPQDVVDDEELDLEFDSEPSEEGTVSRPPLELPPPPEQNADEEIVIEAPPALWGAFEDEDNSDETEGPASASEQPPRQTKKSALEGFEVLDDIAKEDEPGPTVTQIRRAALRSGEPRSKPVRVASGDSTSELSRSSVTMADDVRMVEIPHPRRVKPWYWVIAGVLLLLLILWQVKIFYLDDLAQSPSLRPFVTAMCATLGCQVPPRRALGMIQVSGTQVNQHPEVPGALQVTVNLVNRANFSQGLPPLEVTLTDKSGQVVGRRTYNAKEYTSNKAVDLAPNVTRNIFIDLAQPANTAVGYEVQLVGR